MSTRVARVLGLLTAAALCGCSSTPSKQQPVTPPISDVTQPVFGPSQSLSQDDLRRTGRPDLTSAVKALVPAAH
jgi:hypothetical protein